MNQCLFISGVKSIVSFNLNPTKSIRDQEYLFLSEKDHIGADGSFADIARRNPEFPN